MGYLFLYFGYSREHLVETPRPLNDYFASELFQSGVLLFVGGLGWDGVKLREWDFS